MAVELLDQPVAAPGHGTTEDTAVAPKRVLVCARCQHEVTRHDARIVRGGSHQHTRINPDGDVYEIGCFAEAAVRSIGEPTDYFTWFPGFAWRVAVCGSCGEHLGWRYDGESGSFFGLILEQLTG